MTAVIHIISFSLIVIAAGYLLRKSLSDVLPFVWCGLILVLYVLAYGRALGAIDFIMPLVACAGVAFCVVRRGNGDTHQRIDAGIVAYLTLCMILPFALSARIVTWWDDINFWASDLKALYYLGGFAKKYANVSPQFGDYPPAVQLAKWYLVHMDRHIFRENLAFVGYHLFNLSFLMPLFGRLKGKKALWGIPLAFAAWAFAGIAEIFGYAGFCADLSMAYLFGSVLIAAAGCGRAGKITVGSDYDRTDSESSFMTGPDSDLPNFYDVIKTGLYLSVLSLCKSTGYIWALLAGIVWCASCMLNMTHVTKKSIIRLMPALAMPLIFGGSWVVFCLIDHRVAQTTSTMVTYMTTDTYGLSAYTTEFANAFIRAFFTRPLHIDHTWIDLPPAVMFLLIVVLLILLRRFGFINGRSGTFICVSLPVCGLIYYVLIFIAHITMFATETQYLEPEGMIASIERYGAPYMLGCLLFISYVWLMHDDNRGGQPGDDSSIQHDDKQPVQHDDKRSGQRDLTPARLRIFVICIIALTNIPAAFDGLIGYRTEVEEAGELRNAFIEKDSEKFLEALVEAGLGPEDIPRGGTRICRVRDGAYYRVQDTYVAYEASPVSVLSPSVQLKDTDADFFVNMVNDTHAEYLYVDEQPGEYPYLDELLADDVTGGFRYDTVYRISYEAGRMVLRKE